MQNKKYSFPHHLRAEIKFALVGSILMMLVLLGVVIFEPGGYNKQRAPILSLLIISIGMALTFTRLNRLCAIEIEVSKQGIEVKSPNQAPTFLHWSEIGEVRTNDFRQRLELHSKQGKTVILVEHQIEEFDELNRVISQMTSGF